MHVIRFDDKDECSVLMVPQHRAEDSDDAQMARIAARDGAAFTRVANEHGGKAHRIAYRMLGDASAAEDVAQETLLRLWTHADRWQTGQAGIAAWLSRVAMNLCLDRLRRHKFVSDEPVPDRADPAINADAAMVDAQQCGAVRAVIGTMPDRQRAAIVLTYYEDYSNLMAAKALDMNLKAFESLLFRSRAALRSALVARGITTAEGAA